MSINRAGLALLLSIVCAGALALVLGSRVLAGTEDQPDSSLAIEWALTPTSLDELTANSQIVVAGYPTGATDGEPIAIEEPEGLPPIPTRLTEFAVTEELAGDAPEKLTVLQIGSSKQQVPEDPAYELGRPYVLFLEPEAPGRWGEDQIWAITAPEGRLEEMADGSLVSKVEGPVAEELHAVETDEIAALINPALVENPGEEPPAGPGDEPDPTEPGAAEPEGE